MGGQDYDYDYYDVGEKQVVRLMFVALWMYVKKVNMRNSNW
eukprot:CAMPEP_0116059690 /NCGR_PEP_ID=MMETSP0322-20121206/5947_1 /TAXON_ID=163516 /ORGANISM="Leptocylindrus danicus var. apora, Strain B651" /LENGTH=40 /DNA_ID= /DNA_START= /DNA_END= /DNA_ORIENTATION=